MSSLLKKTTDILVIGCGAAGMAAASSAAAYGLNVVAADDRPAPGGVLPQCVHSGFGLGRYGKDMSGPDYRDEEYKRFERSGALYMPQSRVLSITADRIAFISGPEGMIELRFSECILASGCRERSIWSLPVSGTRPSGIYTAGEAQELIEIGRYDVGSRIFILGSGDVGQIMARRFSQLGKTVLGMAELSDRPGGMKRNHRECIEAYNIPVMLNSTITEIHGFPHLTGVTLHHILTGEDRLVECDTLITALGLIPDRSLADSLADTSGYPDWLHFCGNADYVHEIADSASMQGERTGSAAAAKLKKLKKLKKADKDQGELT